MWHDIEGKDLNPAALGDSMLRSGSEDDTRTLALVLALTLTLTLTSPPQT